MKKRGVYYKLLSASGRSLIAGATRRPVGKCIQYPLPKDGAPRDWIKVPGYGAFVMRLNASLAGFPRRPASKVILVRLECKGLLKRAKAKRGRRRRLWLPSGTRRFRNVRVVEIVDWNTLPASAGYWRQRFASLPCIKPKLRAELVLGIDPTLPDDRATAAQTPGLTRGERWELVSSLPPIPRYRCWAAQFVPGLTASQRAELVKDIVWTNAVDKPRRRLR